MKHYTSMEQSKKLLELGMPAESADMYWLDSVHVNEDIGERFSAYELKVGKYYDNHSCLPCWSVGALFELMPRGTSLGSRIKFDKYYIVFSNIQRVPTFHDTITDACYEAMCFLLENNYINKGE